MFALSYTFGVFVFAVYFAVSVFVFALSYTFGVFVITVFFSFRFVFAVCLLSVCVCSGSFAFGVLGFTVS